MASPPVRAVIFWGVCLPLRAYLASLGNYRPLRVFAAVIGYRWLAGLTRNSVGIFGGPAFWADARPVHGALWSAYAVSGQSLFLWWDVGFGAVTWIRG